MADNIGITRVPTNEEMQDYKQLGTYTPKERFLKALSEAEVKFTRNHKPFDGQCAKLDFADRIEKVEKESERKFGFVRESDVRNMKFDKLEEYGDPKRFELVGDDEEIEIQNVNNTRTGVTTGHTMKYKCTERGHGCSVFIPMDLYEERFGTKKKVKEE